MTNHQHPESITIILTPTYIGNETILNVTAPTGSGFNTAFPEMKCYLSSLFIVGLPIEGLPPSIEWTATTIREFVFKLHELKDQYFSSDTKIGNTAKGNLNVALAYMYAFHTGHKWKYFIRFKIDRQMSGSIGHLCNPKAYKALGWYSDCIFLSHEQEDVLKEYELDKGQWAYVATDDSKSIVPTWLALAKDITGKDHELHNPSHLDKIIAATESDDGLVLSA
jgi:hypothetical protein